MRLIHWSADPRRWPARAAGAAVAAGAVCGAIAAWHLPGGVRHALGGRVAGYVQARSGSRPGVLGPALDGWLRAAAPVWAAGLWRGAGVPLVLAALAAHGFALAFALAVAAAAGGFWAGLLAVLPGNVAALPALCWLGGRAVALAARGAGRPTVPASYLQVGAAVLLAVTCSSIAEAAAAPLLLRAIG